jgi:phosphatidylserine/phosphatidylglycerophosphate/cardiolipin synthase-like enzyme
MVAMAELIKIGWLLVAVAILGAVGGRHSYNLPGSIAVHFSPEEDLERVDVGLIGSAEAGDSIDAAWYVATDFRVLGALADAAARGCRVRLYLDPEQVAQSNWWSNLEHPMQRLIAAGGIVRIKAPGALMHLKGYVVAGKFLRTGSANLSFDGLRKQDNDVVVIRNADVVARFSVKFAAIWDRSDNVEMR